MAPTQTNNDLTAWRGHDLVDATGAKIGNIADIYLDEETGQPEWVAVSTGMFGTKVSFVPLAGATPQGDVLVSQWDKDTVKGAPRAEADGHLSQQEEAELYSYYGMGYSESRSDSGLPAGGGQNQSRSDVEETRTVGRDTSGPTTDSAMTRSEEELRVGTERREAGRVRLRKYVETERETASVPVSHEEVRIEREPITEANRDAALAGPDISEEEHEVILTEERPVVDKVTVPKERVRLDTETVTDTERVEGDVRKERVVVDGDDEIIDQAKRNS